MNLFIGIIMTGVCIIALVMIVHDYKHNMKKLEHVLREREKDSE